MRTLASDGARVSPATTLSLRLSRQPHLVCDLALTCHHPRQLCDYCQGESPAAWRRHRALKMDYLHPVRVYKTVILDRVQKTFNKNQSEEISTETAL